jgi:SAM-dependent methyltransferase
MDLFGVYLGGKLGLYRALADEGPLTSDGLAATAAIHERYAREWLEQQAVSGILDVDDPAAGTHERRYSLPAGHDEALLDESSLSYVIPLAQLTVGAARPIDALLDAFRSGAGVPYADYGADLHEGIEAFTRPLFESFLGSEWLPAVPEIHDRLSAVPPARVADLACGAGRSTLAIARSYPKAEVDGIDLDEASIARARANLAESGLADRVRFHSRDAADPGLAGRYDLVTIFEALHDMSHPVEVLRTARGLLAAGGTLLVGDEKNAEAFTLEPADYERLNYGFSMLHCLPVGMVGENPAGTGAVMRPGTVREYGLAAGFREVEVLPIESDFWSFYRLTP